MTNTAQRVAAGGDGRCSSCLHAYHRGPCHVTVRSPLVEAPNGDFSCWCPPDADWPGEDDDG